MSAVSPSTELLAVATTFDLSWAEIERLVVNAIEAGFAPYEERRRIIDDVVRPAYAAGRRGRTLTTAMARIPRHPRRTTRRRGSSTSRSTTRRTWRPGASWLAANC